MHNKHDYGYKMLFANPELLRQLLTSFVNEPWVHQIDYEHIELIENEASPGYSD